MNELNIEELIKKAREENVRIEVRITPDEYGRVSQELTVEPFIPYEPKCPFGTPIITVKESK